MNTGSIDPKEKRLNEFKDWFDGFTKIVRSLQSKGKLGQVSVSHIDTGNFSFSQNAADVVNDKYWELMDNFVRPMVGASNGDPETNIDRYKICSLTELTIVTLQPIECDAVILARMLNARLAYYCALSIVSSWDGVAVGKIQKKVLSKVEENHVVWLQNYDPENFVPPIFSNAVTWQLIHENYLLRVKLEKCKQTEV